MRGRFISFEGGEGTGKSTHAAMLAHRLKSHGIDVLLTREPGGSPGAEIMRHVILSGAAKPLGAETEALLFAAARDDHVRTSIGPALERGTWVLCDRFADSTRIYQGVVGHVDERLIGALQRITIGEMKPDLTFVLDVPVDIGLTRASKRRGAATADRFEAEAREFHERLRAAYRDLAAREPDRCMLIDVTAPRDQVAAQIWNLVDIRLRVQASAPGRRKTAP